MERGSCRGPRGPPSPARVARSSHSALLLAVPCVRRQPRGYVAQIRVRSPLMSFFRRWVFFEDFWHKMLCARSALVVLPTCSVKHARASRACLAPPCRLASPLSVTWSVTWTGGCAPGAARRPGTRGPQNGTVYLDGLARFSTVLAASFPLLASALAGRRGGMGMEPAYPAVPITTRVTTAGFDRSRSAGQGRRFERIFHLHFGYRSWDRLPQRGALNQLS